MSIRTWFRTPRVRRGLAVSVIALAAGGLVLYRAPASAKGSSSWGDGDGPRVTSQAEANGKSSVAFSGPGLRGVFALSHTKVLAGGTTRLFAELTMTADEASDVARARAPLSLAIVLDTSGSMSGEKIDRARESVVTLLREMQDTDEVALVRYSSNEELVQQLARVGDVRESLIRRVRALQADGGTNIPPALSRGLSALSDASSGRVRRVVLVSDGLDSTRARAEAIARESGARGITTSSLGIGLDFDESYMGGVARAGLGNFAFIENGDALAGFLRKELKETAATTIERASARITLPPGVRFVRATGAEATSLDDGRTVELSVGSLFSGDQRRVVLELAASLDAGDVLGLRGDVAWTQVGGEATRADFSGLTLSATRDEQAVIEARDGAVFASATSAMASIRQIEAAEAYQSGDGARAKALIDQNIADLSVAQAAAPAPVATALERQKSEYEGTAQSFVAASPKSAEGKKAAKASPTDVTRRRARR
jgi:Ca-activated chloride channel family protein